jgi:hypothetical protein
MTIERHELQLTSHDRHITRLENDLAELRRQMNASLAAISQWITTDGAERARRQKEYDIARTTTDHRLLTIERSMQALIVIGALVMLLLLVLIGLLLRRWGIL